MAQLHLAQHLDLGTSLASTISSSRSSPKRGGFGEAQEVQRKLHRFLFLARHGGKDPYITKDGVGACISYGFSGAEHQLHALETLKGPRLIAKSSWTMCCATSDSPSSSLHRSSSRASRVALLAQWPCSSGRSAGGEWRTWIFERKLSSCF